MIHNRLLCCHSYHNCRLLCYHKSHNSRCHNHIRQFSDYNYHSPPGFLFVTPFAD